MFDRLWNVLRQRRVENEIRQEMESHLALIEEEEVAQGVDPQAARRNARLRFGNLALHREATRDANLAIWLDDMLRDLKFAYRQLLRNPGFAAAGVLLLGLGIGVNAAIFTVVRSVILRPLPLPDPERLVSVVEASGGFETPESWPDLLDLQEGSHVFASSGGFMRSSFVFRGSADALNIKGSSATPGYFSTLQVQPIAGRLFETAEGQEGATPVALIREDFWRAALDADPEILRRTILLNGRATQVVGILPSQFRFPTGDSVVWTPLIPQGPQKNRGYHAIGMVGRLKPSVTLAQAQADLEIVMRRLAREYPDQDAGHSAKVVSLQDWSLDKRLRDRLMVLQIAALALFLMACANLSSLLLARNSARRREFEIRLAIGASHSRQIRQHLTESLLLTGAGCVAAVGLAAAGVRFLVWLYGDDMPRAAEIAPDWKLVMEVIAIAIAGAIAVGLATALHRRPDASGVSVALGSRASADRAGVWTRKLLVVFQLTCAVVLLTSTVQVLESFWTLLHVDVGFDRGHLITMRVTAPLGRYRTGAEIGQRFERVASSVAATPGVRQAAAVNMLPIAEWGFNGNVNVEGMADEHRGFFAEYRWITKDYLRTMGIPLLRGRQFLPEEVAGKQKAAIINQTMAHQLWGDLDPIGAHINMFSPEWITVVGIARDVRQSGVTVSPSAEVYLPAATFVVAAPSWSVVLRSELPADSLIPAIRNAIRTEEPEAAVDRVMTMEEVIADSVSAQRIVATLLVCFAVLALLLASLGLYSVLTFTVVARLPELAIRAALGSTPRALVALVGGEGIALVAVGVGIGFAGMVPLQPLLNRFILDVGPLSAPLCAAVLAILLAIGAAAVAVPAWRAARVDPIRVLRGD
jgi:putative ABC transport system permease protein